MNEIKFVGYNGTHSSDFIYAYPAEHNFYLLILTHTPAQFMVNGVLESFPAHSAILYSPGQPIYYKANDTEYKNDWLHLVTQETFVTQFPLQNEPFIVSDAEYCHNLFRLLTWESSFSSGNSEIILSNLLRVLFLKLQEDSIRRPENLHAHSLLQLRKEIYNSPQLPWKVNQMAEQLHLSTGYLEILYKNTFGVSCMEDVIEGRIRMAKDQLIYTTKSVGEIATLCGYNNVEHFSRQFRLLCGCTPSQFRRNYLNSRHTSQTIHYTVAGSPVIKELSGPK